MSRAFLLPCPDARLEAVLTLLELRGLPWRTQPVSASWTSISLPPFAKELAEQVVGQAELWLEQCALDLCESSYRHDLLTGFDVSLEALEEKDRLRIAGFAMHNVLMWLQMEGYLSDEGIAQLRALVAEMRDAGGQLASSLAYYGRSYANAGVKFYDAFVGFANRLLTGSSKNAGRLVVEGNLHSLLFTAYSNAAIALGDTATARLLEQKNAEVRARIGSFARQ